MAIKLQAHSGHENKIWMYRFAVRLPFPADVARIGNAGDRRRRAGQSAVLAFGEVDLN